MGALSTLLLAGALVACCSGSRPSSTITTSCWWASWLLRSHCRTRNVRTSRPSRAAVVTSNSRHTSTGRSRSAARPSIRGVSPTNWVSSLPGHRPTPRPSGRCPGAPGDGLCHPMLRRRDRLTAPFRFRRIGPARTTEQPGQGGDPGRRRTLDVAEIRRPQGRSRLARGPDRHEGVCGRTDKRSCIGFCTHPAAPSPWTLDPRCHGRRAAGWTRATGAFCELLLGRPGLSAQRRAPPIGGSSPEAGDPTAAGVDTIEMRRCRESAARPPSARPLSDADEDGRACAFHEAQEAAAAGA